MQTLKSYATVNMCCQQNLYHMHFKVGVIIYLDFYELVTKGCKKATLFEREYSCGCKECVKTFAKSLISVKSDSFKVKKKRNFNFKVAL